MRPTSPATLRAQLHGLGVRPGQTLIVHTAYRALRPIEGGPLALIAALRAALGPTGTLVMPTMSAGDAPYDPATTPTVDMGITAELFRQQPGVLRSAHPGASFAAIGPHAAAICRPQPLAPPHGPESPVGYAHALDAHVLLLGVGHDANTTLHLAEALAGVPYQTRHPCVVERDGRHETVEIPEPDHCCRGFTRLDPWLRARALQHEGPLAHGHARLARSRDIVAVALEHLTRDPLVFLCPPTTCEECDLARASVPGQPVRARGPAPR
ncbi:MAG: AAC(3) family N-acetyltransferase [Myxococcales bacterium]|nr:AAC(3) family N-acetyltransferase [Myxococcales bacterium]MCB9542658.1 AAC(3) family N-acetyltransferase [Myxococcales bacterium]